MHINTDQFMQMSRELEAHHEIFYVLWEMGEPVFTKSISTAAIIFDREGNQINFLFNPDFYERLSPYDRKFVICHECMHVILRHGVRAKDANDQRANIAMDLVVNHLLENKFGFDRKDLSIADVLCWVDRVFPGKEVPSNSYFEHYLNLLKDYNGNLMPVDCHDSLGDCDWDETIDDLKESHGQALNSAGNAVGRNLYLADTKPVSTKKKWESIIKKWSRKHLKENLTDVEQWTRLNRRLSILETDFLLPSEMETDGKDEEKKIEVWFFLDTSGSCFDHKDRFFKAAKSLPPEKFIIKLFCFDTQVYETSLKSGKMYGFGGTSFKIIENYIQRNMRLMEEPYVESVFVLTDGYSHDLVSPQYPQKWHFFLTTNHTFCIPGKAHVYKLNEFE